MKVINVHSLSDTKREVTCPRGGFTSLRILVESDLMGFTLTRTLVPKGTPQHWHYKQHLEACYCTGGHGVLVDKASGKKYVVKPDTVYVLDKHDDHTFEAIEDTVLLCVFNPPLKGGELHNYDGSY